MMSMERFLRGFCLGLAIVAPIVLAGFWIGAKAATEDAQRVMAPLSIADILEKLETIDGRLVGIMGNTAMAVPSRS